MKSNRERYLVFALYAAVVFHIVATVVTYSLPDDSKGLLALGKAYTSDIFFQKWNFFAPSPGVITDKIWIQCHHQEDRWIDPADEILKHSYYSPLPSGYRRTYAIRELSTRVHKSLKAITSEICNQQAKPSEEFTYANQGHNVDLTADEMTICKEAFERIKKTKAYIDLVKVSREICDERFAAPSISNPSIILSQKHPFPLSAVADGRLPEKAYYKMSVVDFEKGEGSCQN